MMKLLVSLALLCVHISLASRTTIQQKISNFKDTLKKIEENPNFGLSQRTSSSIYMIQLYIPPGPQRYYGAQYGQETARKAVSMIAQEYLKSLELVGKGELTSPVTFHQLKVRYDEMFPKPATPIDAQISKLRNMLKKIEKKPSMYINSHQYSKKCSYIVRPEIPLGIKHCYGTLDDQAAAQGAVLMIVKEYLKSLELVRERKAEAPATVEDLQQKYDEMFPKNMDVSKFEKTLKKIEQNPNFGLQLSGHRIYLNVRIPIVERYLYGSHSDHATARKALLMIANEYKKSLECESPATFHQLKLKYDAMFGEAQKKVFLPSECNYEENKLDIENGKNNLLLIFQMTSQKPNQADEEDEKARDNSELNKIFSNSYRNLQKAERQSMKQTLRKATDEQNKANTSEETDEKPSNKAYKIRRIWNTPEDEPEHDYYLGGYFKVVNPHDVFWVNTIKKVDGRLTGYYKEYGGCRGWVNLEHFESTDFDEPIEMNETLKRKREESESCSELEESTRGSSNN